MISRDESLMSVSVDFLKCFFMKSLIVMWSLISNIMSYKYGVF